MIYVIVRLLDRNDCCMVMCMFQVMDLRLVYIICGHWYTVVIINLHILITGSPMAVVNRSKIRKIHIIHSPSCSFRLADDDKQQVQLERNKLKFVLHLNRNFANYLNFSHY